MSFALSSLNLADGLLKRHGLLRIGFGGVKSADVIKVFEIIEDTVPLCERQQDGFAALLLIHNIFRMQCHHDLTSDHQYDMLPLLDQITSPSDSQDKRPSRFQILRE
jgi:hypothetical protein